MVNTTQSVVSRAVRMLSVLAALLTGCTPLFPSPTPTATPSGTPSPTARPTSTPTTTLTPTSTPTATPTPEWVNAHLFDRTTWSERALAVWNNPEAAPLEEHQWFHEYLTATSSSFLAELGWENPALLRTSLEHLVDPPNGAAPVVAGVTAEAFGQMNDREVTELAASLDRRQQLWLLFEYNMALPETERLVIPISSVDKAAILTDPLNFFVYYPQTSDDGTREEWPTRFPWLYEDGAQMRRYGRWVGEWGAPDPYQREYLLRALRNEYSPELTFYGYTPSELLGTDVPSAIPGYIAAQTEGDLWGLVESPAQIIPEFVMRLIDREGHQSLLPFAYSTEDFTIPHAACWCTPRPTRIGPQFIPDIGDGTVPGDSDMFVEPDRWHGRTPTISEIQHFIGDGIMLPEQRIYIYTEGQRFSGSAYVNGILYTNGFYIIPLETRAEQNAE